MEAGRRVDVATSLLSAKDVPYVVAAPLLIQDLKSWRRDGVQGLQQVRVPFLRACFGCTCVPTLMLSSCFSLHSSLS